MIAEYVSDPVIALAANYLSIDSQYDFSWETVLPRLIDKIKQGQVIEQSYRGELVARLLLSMAWDDCCGKDDFVCSSIRPVSVQTFLTNLGGAKLIKKMKKSKISETNLERLLNGYVFFTHFLPVTYSVKEQDLRNCFARSAAMIIKRGEVAIDLIIPILLKDNKMSYISVQVNNYSRECEPTKDLILENDKLSLMQDVPYLATVMNLGQPLMKSRQQALQGPSAFQVENVFEASQSSSLYSCRKLKLLAPKSTDISKEPLAENHTSEIPSLGTLIVLNGLNENTYPFIAKKSERSKLSILTSLAELAACWADPITYVKKTKPFNTRRSIQSWFKHSYDWNDKETWK